MNDKMKLIVRVALSIGFGLLVGCHSVQEVSESEQRLDASGVSAERSEHAGAIRILSNCEVLIDSPEMLRPDSPAVMVRARRMVVRSTTDAAAAEMASAESSDSVRVVAEAQESASNRSAGASRSWQMMLLWGFAAGCVAFILIQSFVRRYLRR